MSIKHTAGPLHVEKSCGRYEIWPKDNGQTHSFVGIAQRKEDASLFAAAPELLEACKNLLSLFDSGWAVRDTSDDASPGFALRQIEPMRKLSFAKGAIAKAETI